MLSHGADNPPTASQPAKILWRFYKTNFENNQYQSLDKVSVKSTTLSTHPTSNHPHTQKVAFADDRAKAIL